MTRKLTIAALIAAAALALAAGAVAASAADSHPDPTGDANGAADVASVDVGNDYIRGAFVIWIDFADRASLNAGEGVAARFDTDLNQSTGAADGADYVIEIDAQKICGLYRWQGDTFYLVPSPSLTCKFVDKSVRVEVQPTDLGDSKSINFYVITFAGDTSGDIVPDGSDLWFSYTVRGGNVPLSIDSATLAPTPPRARRVVRATLVVGRDDTLDRLDSATVTCVLTVGNRPVAAVESGFVDGSAVCASRLPSWARGKPYRLSLTVGFGHSSVTKTFIGTVR
jgi:hypothetical protein